MGKSDSYTEPEYKYLENITDGYIGQREMSEKQKRNIFSIGNKDRCPHSKYEFDRRDKRNYCAKCGIEKSDDDRHDIVIQRPTRWKDFYGKSNTHLHIGLRKKKKNIISKLKSKITKKKTKTKTNLREKSSKSKTKKVKGNVKKKGATKVNKNKAKRNTKSKGR